MNLIMETPPIKVSRNGTEIGTYELSRILDLVRDNKLLPTDHYWQQGMIGWRPLATLIADLEENQRIELLAQKRRESIDRARLDANQVEQQRTADDPVERQNKEESFDIERIFFMLIALPFLFCGGAMIIDNIGRGNFAYGSTSTAMTNGLLCFGVGVLLAKK